MKILLVQPDFPIPAKSKNHFKFMPVGLLKIGSYHLSLGDKVKLVKGHRRCGFTPDRVLITSLFTYWSRYVHEAALFYANAYPTAEIEIGGIYATLLPDHCKGISPFAKVRPGLYMNGAAERIPLEYSLLDNDIDYQIIHSTRGCTKHCSYCGTWRIEPEFTFKTSIISEIKKPILIFYDNNFLANPNIDKILREISEFRLPGNRTVSCETQSGLDLDLLSPERVKLLRAARFKYPRVAWDGDYPEWPKIKEAIELLKSVGYGCRDIFIFMIYNFKIPYQILRKKLDACRRWQVRVSDCRYRPLVSTDEFYVPGSKPNEMSHYYIHPTWTDSQVRAFRRAVRRQNIAVMLALPNAKYVDGCERRFVNTA